MKKFIPYLLLLTLFFSLNTAAMPVSTAATPPTGPSIPPIIMKWLEGQKKKLNFFERIVYKMMVKKMKKTIAKANDRPVDADRLARQAHLMGWLSLAAFFIFPLASIPLAIIAIINGSAALEHGTTLAQKARTGRTVGIITLAMIVALICLVVIIFVGFTFT